MSLHLRYGYGAWDCLVRTNNAQKNGKILQKKKRIFVKVYLQHTDNIITPGQSSFFNTANAEDSLQLTALLYLCTYQI